MSVEAGFLGGTSRTMLADTKPSSLLTNHSLAPAACSLVDLSQACCAALSRLALAPAEEPPLLLRTIRQLLAPPVNKGGVPMAGCNDWGSEPLLDILRRATWPTSEEIPRTFAPSL